MNKDKLNTWIYFREAVEADVSLEEIVGVLFWKGKDMLLRKNFSKYSGDQLKTFISKLSYLLPEARKKGADAEAAFEKFFPLRNELYQSRCHVSQLSRYHYNELQPFDVAFELAVRF